MEHKVFDWKLDKFLYTYLKDEVMEKTLINFQNNLEHNISANKLLSPEQLDEKYASQPDNLDFLYVYAILSVERKPGISRNIFLRILDEEGLLAMAILASVIQYPYPSAYQMIVHILQYGPLVSWENEIGYEEEVDAAVEKCISEFPNVLMYQYMSRFPSCGMFKALHAFWLGRKAQAHSNSLEVTGTYIPEICENLAQALEQGIPDKYKYFVANYLTIWEREIHNFNFKYENSFGIMAFNCFIWFLSFCTYYLFPNKQNKEMLLSHIPGTELTEIKKRILFGPPLTIKEALQRVKSVGGHYKEEKETAEMGNGCLIGCLFGVLVLIFIGLMFVFSHK